MRSMIWIVPAPRLSVSPCCLCWILFGSCVACVLMWTPFFYISDSVKAATAAVTRKLYKQQQHIPTCSSGAKSLINWLDVQTFVNEEIIFFSHSYSFFNVDSRILWLSTFFVWHCYSIAWEFIRSSSSSSSSSICEWSRISHITQGGFRRTSARFNNVRYRTSVCVAALSSTNR